MVPWGEPLIQNGLLMPNPGWSRQTETKIEGLRAKVQALALVTNTNDSGGPVVLSLKSFTKNQA